MRRQGRWTCGIMVIVAAMAICSCQVAPSAERAESVAAAGKDGGELAYELSQKKWCSNDEACSMVLHLVGGGDECASFAERLEKLKGQDVVVDGWKLEADEPVTKGTLAYMLCQALKIDGGLLMHIVPGRRYAYREMVYREIMSKGSEYEPLTGPEAVGIVGRAARMQDSGE